MTHGAYISGVGAYLPEEIRTNAFWPPEVVASWQKKNKGIVERIWEEAEQKAQYFHPAVLEEMAKKDKDTFKGFKERRVAPRDMLPSQMEMHAAKQALADAGVKPDQVGLVMTFSLPPDHFNIPTAFKLQNQLGLANAMAFELNAICNSMIAMINVATQFVASGTCEHVLAVISTKYSDIQDYTSSMSVWAGDGAGAVVISRCKKDEGVLAVVNKADGTFHDSILIVERQPHLKQSSRYNFGEQPREVRYYLTAANPAKGAEMIGRIPHWIATDCKAALDAAGMTSNDVDLLVTNAAAPWYAPSVARILEVPMSKVEDNVESFNNMGHAIWS